MKKVLHSIFSDSGLFLWVLIIGAFLRFWAPLDIPFTHDELSAIYRLQFDSFGALIEGGVRVDGHPALIQVFLFYWTNLCGTSEFLVKVPFLLLGVFSLYITYAIGKLWFNPTVALLTTAFVATLQFPIMYSQIARPYVSGMFFSLLLVYYWTKFLFLTSHSNRMYLGMIFTATLCSYNHYFSLMFAGIVGVTGLFFVNKNERKKYLLAFGVVSLLFLPHIGIFIDQLRLGGLNWLSQPSLYFFVEHIQFIFHFNLAVYLLVFLILVTGIVKNNRLIYSKYQYISLIWFMLPIAIGMGYSIFIKPVIQHSMLIFSFPFLILFVISFLPELSRTWKLSFVILIVLINTMTLMENRKHYDIFYAQPFERTFKLADFANNNYPNTYFIFNGNPNYHAYYFKDSEITFTSIFDSIPLAHEFRTNLKHIPSDYLYLSNIPANLQEVAKEVFPYLTLKQQGLNREDILLSKNIHDLNARILNTPFFSSTYNNYGDWNNFDSDSVFKDGTGFILNNTQEYGPTIEIDLDTLTFNRFTQVHAQIDVPNIPSGSGIITCELYQNYKRISWQGRNVEEYISKTDSIKEVTAHLTINLHNTIKAYHSLKGYHLKISFWNKNLQAQRLSNFTVELKRSNPWEYGIIEPIPTVR